MRIAYLHALPLEYYPPARNTLTLMCRRPGWQVRAWSSRNRRGLRTWDQSGVEVTRPTDADPRSILPLRVAGYLAWHVRAAAGIAAWRPDALISVEPHSALAAWMYYNIFRGKAALFIHHHEYYAPEDFLRPGMRLLRSTCRLERGDLFARAAWVSQTNEERMRLLRAWNPNIRGDAARILPNYPPEEWIGKAAALHSRPASGRIRLIYLGSVSFEDTFIREAATWVARHADRASLHVAGNNIKQEVWNWLHALGSPNITFDSSGCDYSELPDLLTQFDVGLVLYKGNTLNFVHNIPNKTIEYLACGLDVWYPREVEGMRRFHESFPEERLVEVDFRDPAASIPIVAPSAGKQRDFPYTCEAAMAPLFAELERLGHKTHE
jgi:hypothetical protein